KTLAGVSASGDLAPAWLKTFIPATLQVGGVSFRSTASGPIGAIDHKGDLTAVDVGIANLKPMMIAGSWSGRGAAISTATVIARTDQATLEATGSADTTSATIAALSLRPTAPQTLSSPLTLGSPVTITWSPTLQVSGLRLAGGSTSLALDWKNAP